MTTIARPHWDKGVGKQRQAQAMKRRDMRVERFLKQRSYAKAREKIGAEKLPAESAPKNRRRKLIKNGMWTKAKSTQVTLSPLEKQICSDAFTKTAMSPLICGHGHTNNASVLSGTLAIKACLQSLGIFLSDENLDTIIAENTTENCTDLTSFFNIVLGTKKLCCHSREKDADLVEAYLGLGGNPGINDNGGLPARNLIMFMKELGVKFDEKARVDAQGDLQDFDYEGSEHSEDLDPAVEESSDEEYVQGNIKSIDAVFAIASEGKLMRRWKAVTWAILATVRIRRSLIPWFLDAARQASLPSTIGGSAGRMKKEYIPSKEWEGRKHGYYFARGVLGLGYYLIKKSIELPSFHDEEAARKDSHVQTPASSEDENDATDEAPTVIKKLRKRINRGKMLLKAVMESSKKRTGEEHQWSTVQEIVPIPVEGFEGELGYVSPPPIERKQAIVLHEPIPMEAITTKSEPPVPSVARCTDMLPNIAILSSESNDNSPENSPCSRNMKSFVFGSMCHGHEMDLRGGYRGTTDTRLSRLFDPGTRTEASSPLTNTFAATVFEALKKPVATCSSFEEPVEEATLHQEKQEEEEEGKCVGFAPSDDNVFRAFEHDRHDRKKSRSSSAFIGWTGAKWMWQGPQALHSNSEKSFREALEHEEKAIRAEKRASTMLREVVFSIMACKKADHITSMWKRDVGTFDNSDMETVKERLQDHSWLVWRDAAVALELQASDVASRTYSERLEELDDQLSDEDEYEVTNDPEMGQKLAKLAQELGLRTCDYDPADEPDDLQFERLSELSDIVTADRFIGFEEFAAFFDRYRVYKGHNHVGAFQLVSRVKTIEKTAYEKMRERLAMSLYYVAGERKSISKTFQKHKMWNDKWSRKGESADQMLHTPSHSRGNPMLVTPKPSRANFFQERMPRSPMKDLSKTSAVLITLGGSLVRPWDGVQYNYTPRREQGKLIKGSSRFIPFDWNKIGEDILRLDQGKRTFDDAETTLLRNALDAFNFSDYFGGIDDDSTQSEVSSSVTSSSSPDIEEDQPKLPKTWNKFTNLLKAGKNRSRGAPDGGGRTVQQIRRVLMMKLASEAAEDDDCNTENKGGNASVEDQLEELADEVNENIGNSAHSELNRTRAFTFADKRELVAFASSHVAPLEETSSSDDDGNGFGLISVRQKSRTGTLIKIPQETNDGEPNYITVKGVPIVLSIDQLRGAEESRTACEMLKKIKKRKLKHARRVTRRTPTVKKTERLAAVKAREEVRVKPHNRVFKHKEELASKPKEPPDECSSQDKKVSIFCGNSSGTLTSEDPKTPITPVSSSVTMTPVNPLFCVTPMSEPVSLVLPNKPSALKKKPVIDSGCATRTSIRPALSTTFDLRLEEFGPSATPLPSSPATPLPITPGVPTLPPALAIDNVDVGSPCSVSPRVHFEDPPLEPSEQPPPRPVPVYNLFKPRPPDKSIGAKKFARHINATYLNVRRRL